MTDLPGRLTQFWLNQLGGTFLLPGSTLSLFGLLATLLLAAFLAVPRTRSRMPRLKVWRRALFPRRLTRSASGRADLGYFLFSLFGAGILFGWALIAAAPVAALVLQAQLSAFGPARPVHLPIWLAGSIVTAALFLAYEFAYWLDHYLSHKVPLLWRFHRVHHAAESLSLLTTFRVHPLDTILFYNLVAIASGMTEGLLRYWIAPDAGGWSIGGTNALIMLSAIGLTHLQHSHLWVTFGPRWGRWLLSPAHHQVHHSADPVHFDRNFGSALAVFDRLFGTLHVPAARREVRRFGLDSAVARPHGWRAAVVTPFADALLLFLPSRRAPESIPLPQR